MAASIILSLEFQSLFPIYVYSGKKWVHSIYSFAIAAVINYT